MSEIKSFSDYTSKYNSNVDYSALFGGTSDSSSVGNTNMLSDYAAIKNGSYGKLMKAYYAKQDAEKLSGKGDTSQKLALMKTSADSLKKSADALNDASLWEKKKIKKKDVKTGEETEVEDYDWDAIAKKVKSFIDDYNDVVKEAGESNTKDVLRNASWMTGMTDKTSHLLSKIGITIGKGNKLELDKDELKMKNRKADTLEEISEKLEMFHNYENEIAAANQEYNNSQMFHVMDEAERTWRKKIAEAAERNKPKTEEERKEEMVDEALGTEENKGMMSEIMDELSETTEEMTEQMTEKTVENMEELPDEVLQEQLATDSLEAAEMVQTDTIKRYVPIDIRV